jgi:hypothetical protein
MLIHFWLLCEWQVLVQTGERGRESRGREEEDSREEQQGVPLIPPMPVPCACLSEAFLFSFLQTNPKMTLIAR